MPAYLPGWPAARKAEKIQRTYNYRYTLRLRSQRERLCLPVSLRRLLPLIPVALTQPCEHDFDSYMVRRAFWVTSHLWAC